MFGAGLIVLLLIVAIAGGIWYLVKWLL